jgi:hypothetical protein
MLDFSVGFQRFESAENFKRQSDGIPAALSSAALFS